jgi:amidase
VDGLPIGIAFFGRAFAEPELIKIAYAFEQKRRCAKHQDSKWLKDAFN